MKYEYSPKRRYKAHVVQLDGLEGNTMIIDAYTEKLYGGRNGIKPVFRQWVRLAEGGRWCIVSKVAFYVD